MMFDNANQAGALLGRFRTVQNAPEREVCLDRIHALYPYIRLVGHELNSDHPWFHVFLLMADANRPGIRVWSDHSGPSIPRAISYQASVITQVRYDMTRVDWKNREPSFWEPESLVAQRLIEWWPHAFAPVAPSQATIWGELLKNLV